jgi:diadenosine tetraphosphatase ApaH/serine/threonine PP2A family protein phosphatase
MEVGKPYKEEFPEGSRVRVTSRAVLDTFARDWKYHHQLQREQLEYAGATATVKEVSFYHGGDVLYKLENVPGIWHEACLESTS